MRSRRNPALALADIVENSERIVTYVAGLTQADFARDGRTRDAVERCLQRVCEAAHRLGDEAEELLPGQPWSEIRGMGNWLRHGYDRINLNVVWQAISHDLPRLEADARQVLESLPAASNEKSGA